MTAEPAEIVAAHAVPQTIIGKDALDRLQQYDSAQFNILQPVVIDPQAEFSGTLAFSVGIVQIDRHAGHTYNDYVFANENKGDYALSALGLQAIARAAGVKVATEQEEYGRDRETGHVYCRYKATVYMLQPNGQPYEVEAHASNDTATLEEQLRFDYAQPRGKTAGLTGADLETKVQKMVLQRKAKIEERTETEAMNRAMRKAFGLKQTYNETELKGKPFVTLRVVERPSVHDARLAIEQGTRATHELFGGDAFPAAGSPEHALPPIDDQTVPGRGNAAGVEFERTLAPSQSAPSGPSSATDGEASSDSASPLVPTVEDGEASHAVVAGSPVADGPEPTEGVEHVSPSVGEEARSDFEFASGRYAGRMVGEIVADDPEYLALLLQGRNDDGLELTLSELRIVARWLAQYEART